jgi:hypothetical protein
MSRDSSPMYDAFYVTHRSVLGSLQERKAVWTVRRPGRESGPSILLGQVWKHHLKLEQQR